MITTNSPAHVTLDPAFEGTFTAATSNASPVITPIQNAEDPAGRGRERKVHMDFVVKGVARGKVVWEPVDRRGQLGSVILTSTNGPVYLTL
jgi:hypothetical protein